MWILCSIGFVSAVVPKIWYKICTHVRYSIQVCNTRYAPSCVPWWGKRYVSLNNDVCWLWVDNVKVSNWDWYVWVYMGRWSESICQCRLVVRTQASHAWDRGFDPLHWYFFWIFLSLESSRTLSFQFRSSFPMQHNQTLLRFPGSRLNQSSLRLDYTSRIADTAFFT